MTLGNTQIVVNGTLNATGDKFRTNNGNYFTGIQVNAGGRIIAANCDFHDIRQLSIDNSSVFQNGDLTGNNFEIPIFVPYKDVQYLANNLSFNDVNINNSTINSGTLSLNQIGNSPSTLQYIFPGGFTVAPGATLSVGSNVAVTVSWGQPLNINGTANFAAGDTVTLGNTQIVVNGTLNATGDKFQTNNGNYFTGIQVNAGGRIIAANCDFHDIRQLSIDNAASSRMAT